MACCTATTALTHLTLMEFPALMNWTSLFPFLGLLYGIFQFYSNFNRTLCKQTLNILNRHNILWRLNLIYTVCLCPQKRTLALYVLIKASQTLFVHMFICFIPFNFICNMPTLKIYLYSHLQYWTFIPNPSGQCCVMSKHMLAYFS